RLERLHEAGAFLGGRGRLPGQESRRLEDAIDTGRAAGGLVGIDHHEGQSPVAFERVAAGEGADAILLIGGEPMIARHPGIVLIDLTEAVPPVVELTLTDADPGDEAGDGDVGLVRPGADEIDDLIAGIVGNPRAPQSSPRLFFSSVCASMS